MFFKLIVVVLIIPKMQLHQVPMHMGCGCSTCLLETPENPVGNASREAVLALSILLIVTVEGEQVIQPCYEIP